MLLLLLLLNLIGVHEGRKRSFGVNALGDTCQRMSIMKIYFGYPTPK